MTIKALIQENESLCVVSFAIPEESETACDDEIYLQLSKLEDEGGKWSPLPGALIVKENGNCYILYNLKEEGCNLPYVRVDEFIRTYLELV